MLHISDEQSINANHIVSIFLENRWDVYCVVFEMVNKRIYRINAGEANKAYDELDKWIRATEEEING